MKTNRLSVLIAVIVLTVIATLVLPPFPWLARESIFEFTARDPKNKNTAESGAPGNSRGAGQLTGL